MSALLKNGAEFRDKISVSKLLAHACENGDLDIVKLALHKGADINHEGKKCKTPVYKAATKARWNVVKYLCENGADAGISNKSGLSILRQPAIDGETEIVKMLLSKGAAADKEDKEGVTPIVHAAINNHFNIVKILCEPEHNVDLTNLDRRKISVLSKICSDGDLDFVKLLLRGRINPSEGDSLKVSLELYHQDITRELINAGTDINKVSTFLFHFNCFVCKRLSFDEIRVVTRSFGF